MIRRDYNHPLIGLAAAIAGSFLGLLLIEFYWLAKNYPIGTAWGFLMNPITRLQYLTFSQIVNVGVFFLFLNTKRDRSANGVIMFFIILAIPLAIQKLL